jgi:hypothetical protein
MEDCPPGTITIDPTQIMDIYFDLAEMFLTESEFASITVTPSIDRLDIEYTFVAMEDTQIGCWLTSSEKTGGYKLAGVLAGTDAVNLVSKYDPEEMKKMNEFFMDMFMDMDLFEGDDDSEFYENWKDMMEKSYAMTGDEMAVSFSLSSGKPPFTFVEVVTVTDGPAYREMMADMWPIVNEMYKSMGMPMSFAYEKGVDSYGGYAIDSAKIIFDFPEDDPSKAVIDAMYGDGLEYKMVVTDEAVVMAMGPDALAQLQAMVDKLKAGASAPAGDLKVAFDTIPGSENADFVGSFNYLKMLEALPEIFKSLPMPPAQAMMMEGMFDDLNISSKSCLAFAGSSANGKLTTQIALPKEHLTEIMGVVMQIQAKAMQNMMQQQQPAPEAAPAPAENVMPAI